MQQNLQENLQILVKRTQKLLSPHVTQGLLTKEKHGPKMSDSAFDVPMKSYFGAELCPS